MQPDQRCRPVEPHGRPQHRGCLKGLLDPIFIMAPINVLSEISTPVSMAFRHFGNILSGTVISTLLYWALASLSHVIFGWLPGFLSQIQLFQILSLIHISEPTRPY